MTDGSSVPDKPLTVECKLELTQNSRRRNLSFQTARDCTYSGLREKITRYFRLTVRFQIQWEDDDREKYVIHDQNSLNEAINYYHYGVEGSVTSGSAFTSRSSRIMMEVEIDVLLDAPTLSDTTSESLASRDEALPLFAEESFPARVLRSSPQDDDAVTVSSRDTGSHQAPRQGRADSSSIRANWNGTSRSGSSPTSNRPTPNSIRWQVFNLVSSRASTTDEEAAGSSSRHNMINGRSSNSLMHTATPYPDDHSAVFERLKLEERQNPLLSPDLSHHTEVKTWVQGQSTLRVGVIPSAVPSISSLNTDTPFSDEAAGTDISVERRERGRHRYTNTGPGSSDFPGDLESEVMDGSQPVSEAGIPYELLVPEEFTDCSECGRILDQIKYTCTTCGENTLNGMSRAALAATAAPHVHRTHGTSYNHLNTSPLPSTSPTQTIFGRSLGPSGSSGSLATTRRIKYELCGRCFKNVGLDHALPGRMGIASSPTMSPTPQELSILRRSPQKRKGELRHAFSCQVWGLHGWQDIEQEEAHRCSVCQSQLSGIRYKCGKCVNFTICRACYNEVHDVHPNDPFLELRVTPLRWDSPSSVSSIFVCNSCGEVIVGVRYQCLNCPSIPNSYNLCLDCEVESYSVHDPMHTFLKIPRPVDISGPLKSRFPIIPILYKYPAGPAPGSPAANTPEDPEAYLRSLTHRSVRCDRHVTTRLAGKWYRCAYCAKDLCAECEALDSHDSTHVFLVFKAPVDMKAFRKQFTDVENPAGNPSVQAVLHGNIYAPRDD